MKRVMLLLLTVSVLLCAMTTIALAQPQAVIEVEAWSPQEIHDLGWTSHPSTGLSVVGVGEQVYLFAKEDTGEVVTAFAWTLSSQPTGSVVTLDSTATPRTTFNPDVEGTYDIDVEITTASGAGTASVTISAAKYVGVGTVGGGTPESFPKGQCGSCHSGNTIAWMATGHSTMFEEAIDGVKSSHYNEGCIECHTVGFFEGADNDGFADIANELGWTFPDTLEDGNWQDIVDNFPALAAVANIQCENCHGPGSLHKGDVAGIDLNLAEGVCGRCHEEAPYHIRSTQWKTSGHATGTSFARGTSSSCAPCHSGWGFIARMDPASDLELKTGNQNISCAVCHDPHDASNAHQLRLSDEIALPSGPTVSAGDNGLLCMSCHHNRREGGGEEYVKNPTSTFRGPHHSNQTEMLFGVKEDIITFGMVLPSSTHKDVVENACVGCHMSGNDRDDLGDHSWAMHTTETVDGVETTFDNVESCKACHDPDMTSFDDMLARDDHDGDGTIEAAQAEIEGLLHDIALMLPPFDSPEVDIRAPIWNTKESLLLRKAAWNYFFVDYDHSHGVHNYQFSVALLKNSKAALMYGALSEGVITGVEDVPNDQGKQVRVTWTRFGGDGISDNPVRRYAIWRKVMANGAAEQDDVLETLNVSDSEIAKMVPGDRLAVAGDLWDFVGELPAATLDEYSTVVPTLYDSTGADGAVLSEFKVSGHTAITAIYAVTEVATGYSIDNLAPATPANLAGVETVAGVALTWAEPIDEDFKFFTLYRGTTSGFDPTLTEPLSELTENEFLDNDVMVGATYYYRLSASDFSENESVYSDEFSFLVTSVAIDGIVPEDYALEQNYPNPFNPSTAIRYSLKDAGNVKVTVYNGVGEKVMVLVDSYKNAGNYEVTLDATHLASGLYFYRIEVNNFRAIRKMIFMK